jgi:hypothetical protein
MELWGFSFDDLRIPKRITETATPQGVIKEDDLREGVKKFERLIRKNNRSL